MALIFLCASGVLDIFGNFLTRATPFVLDLTSIGGLHKELWAFKVARVPILGILGLRSPKTK
jgi:hypothetical protein